MTEHITWGQLNRLRDAAIAAQEAHDQAWFAPGGSYEKALPLRDQRDAAERDFHDLCNRWQAQYGYDMTGRHYEVRVFSSAPAYAPTGGVVCTYTDLTIAEAFEQRDQHNAAPTDESTAFPSHAQAYDTRTRTRLT